MNDSISSPTVEAIPPVEIKEILRPVFFGLMEEDLDELSRAAVTRRFSTGDAICYEGEPGNAVYVIVKGGVEIIQQVDDSSERHLLYSGPGEMFGEMSILQEGVRNATVRAARPSTILEIGKDTFLIVLGRSPSLGIRILVRLAKRFREADQQAIAELRQANEELTQAFEQLERLDRTKSDFIQVSAHELRTPVAALLGYAQMMQNNATVQQDALLNPLVEGVVTSTERLHRVFNSILDVSRLMIGELKVVRSPMSLAVVFAGIQLEVEQALEERSLTLEMVGLDGLPLCYGDPDLLYKAFHHLVNNALKYTPNGGRITVAGQVTEASDVGRCVEVAVEDTGIGIAPADLDLIFEKFYRTGEVALHSSGTTSFKGGGPGLGLAIVRGVVTAHGGRIWAESPGYDEEACPGSRFVVQLPLNMLKHA